MKYVIYGAILLICCIPSLVLSRRAWPPTDPTPRPLTTSGLNREEALAEARKAARNVDGWKDQLNEMDRASLLAEPEPAPDDWVGGKPQAVAFSRRIQRLRAGLKDLAAAKSEPSVPKRVERLEALQKDWRASPRKTDSEAEWLDDLIERSLNKIRDAGSGK